MADGEEQHGVGDLAMEPQVLIQWHPSELRPQPSDQCPTYWQQNEQRVKRQDQTGTSRNPHGKLQRVQTGQSWIGLLLIPVQLVSFHLDSYFVWTCVHRGDSPSKSEQEEVQSPEDGVKEEFWSSELLLRLLCVTHLVESLTGRPVSPSVRMTILVDRRRLAGRSSR